MEGEKPRDEGDSQCRPKDAGNAEQNIANSTDQQTGDSHGHTDLRQRTNATESTENGDFTKREGGKSHGGGKASKRKGVGRRICHQPTEGQGKHGGDSGAEEGEQKCPSADKAHVAVKAHRTDTTLTEFGDATHGGETYAEIGETTNGFNEFGKQIGQTQTNRTDAKDRNLVATNRKQDVQHLHRTEQTGVLENLAKG